MGIIGLPFFFILLLYLMVSFAFLQDTFGRYSLVVILIPLVLIILLFILHSKNKLSNDALINKPTSIRESIRKKWFLAWLACLTARLLWLLMMALINNDIGGYQIYIIFSLLIGLVLYPFVIIVSGIHAKIAERKNRA